MLHWERIAKDDPATIEDDGCGVTYRMEVFGGWLILQTSNFGGQGINSSLGFVPDANHEWKIEKEGSNGDA